MIASLAALTLVATPLPICIRSVWDGDSIRTCSGERIRLANIDAPEMEGSPRCNRSARARLAGSANPPWCDHALAVRSRDALRELLARGPVRIERLGTDRYGRTLARITIAGRDVGAELMRRGLARRWRER